MGQYQNTGDHEFCLDLIRSRDMAEVERTFAGLQTIIPVVNGAPYQSLRRPQMKAARAYFIFISHRLCGRNLKHAQMHLCGPPEGKKELPKSGLFVSSEFDCEPSMVRRHLG
jgi:hypothetical protein